MKKYYVTSEDQDTWEETDIGWFDTIEEGKASVPGVLWEKVMYMMGNFQWEADCGDIVYIMTEQTMRE